MEVVATAAHSCQRWTPTFLSTTTFNDFE